MSQFPNDITLDQYIADLTALRETTGGDIIVKQTCSETCQLRIPQQPHVGHICHTYERPDTEPEDRGKHFSFQPGGEEWHEGFDPPEAKGDRYLIV